MRVVIREARNAWEHGGRNELAPTLQRLRNTIQGDLIFTNAAGPRSADRRQSYRPAARSPRPPRYFFSLPFTRRNNVVWGRPSPDGQYWLFLIAPGRRSMFWFIQTQHLWILGIVVLLCYALAMHLTSPVRKLQRAVDRFGKGDLTARATTTRRDELGQLARTFNLMADRIQTLVTAERRLLMDISHELRSPLARLSVAIELARSGSDSECRSTAFRRKRIAWRFWWANCSR